MDLKKVPADVHKIAITVTIYDAEGRSQNFGQVGNAFVRLANEETNEEVLRFDLGKISPSKQQLSFVNYTVIMDSGSLMQGSGFQGGLGALVRAYGLMIGRKRYSFPF